MLPVNFSLCVSWQRRALPSAVVYVGKRIQRREPAREAERKNKAERRVKVLKAKRGKHLSQSVEIFLPGVSSFWLK